MLAPAADPVVGTRLHRVQFIASSPSSPCSLSARILLRRRICTTALGPDGSRCGAGEGGNELDALEAGPYDVTDFSR